MNIDFESASKIILGSGLFAFLIAEIIKVIRRFKLKRRLIKEIAWEFFKNEIAVKFIIKDFQNLQKDPIRYLNKHSFSTNVVDAIISTGFFTNINFDLVQFITKFLQRFRNVEYELDIFFTLKDEEKLKDLNLEHLSIGESVSKLLLKDFKKSEMFKKLKRKYFLKWNKEKLKHFEKTSNKKIGKKEKKKILEWAKREARK